eukprot:NODE_1153_length_1076_cov_70.111003_g891_i0.p1 GENE.NODE_1153_length_1076_cov_70.111003_g891_i0~~NODE_1153_length_1076_cov_70.111003_g891_i0.p1  ORF type:complete len:114 (+),score=21.57 NODE_1153_length_1076_cov_70.111003_g891_i0:591-932(+)
MVSARTTAYQKVLVHLQDSATYNTKDMAVVVQPFLKEVELPKKADGSYDKSYFAPDCFHFSAKAHADSATAMWDDMLQPVGQKVESWYPGEPLTCYPENRYLCTSKNKGVNGC